MSFKGWPEAAIDFYAGLEADNSKAYWTAHRSTYDECVKAPFEELSAVIEKEFGPLRVFRPNRDIRFSKDKTPYKTTAAAVTESQGGTAYYVQISATGLYAGSGYHHLQTDQLQRFRDAVARQSDRPEARDRGRRAAQEEVRRRRTRVVEARAARVRSRPSPRPPAAHEGHSRRARVR